MEMFAYMPNGVVTELIPRFVDGPDGPVPIEDRYHPDFVALLVPYDASNPPPPAHSLTPSVEDRIATLQAAIDAHLNSAAQQKGYDSILSAALRAGYPGPFRDEGIAFATWMDSCYALGYQLLAQWRAGLLQEPTPEELLAMLPPLQLPT